MLVINRKKGESIKIGNNIEIFINDFMRNNEGKVCSVRIAIKAPKDIKILRNELDKKSV